MTGSNTARFSVMLSFSVMMGLSLPAMAQLPPGRDSYTFPAGGKAGTTVEVRLGGADWTPDVQFFVRDSRVKLEVLGPPGEVLIHEPPYWFDIKSYANDPRLPREVSARFHLPADLPAGPVRWSVANANGAGPGGVFVVGKGNEITEREDRQGPQDLPSLPLTINGRLRRIEEVDRYRFVASHDGMVTCEMFARRLGSEINSVLEAWQDTDKLTEAVDTEGTDPVLTFPVRKGKPYVLVVRDLDHRGYRNFTYRLTLTPGPRIVTAFPSAGKRGEKRPITFQGIGIATGQLRPEQLTREVAFPADPNRTMFPYQLVTPFGITPAITLALSDQVENLEPDKGAASQKIKLSQPGAISGRISRRGERDTYWLAGKKGDLIDLHLQAREMGSTLDPTLTVMGLDGKPLISKDDSGNSPDPRFPVTLPADGEYPLIVADVSGRIPGPDAIYRLSAQRIRDDFRLRTVEFVSIPLGGKATWTVQVERLGAFKGAIPLTLTGLPPGVTPPAKLEIPANANELAIPLECSASTAVTASLARVTGSAKVGNQTLQRTAEVPSDQPGLDTTLIAITMKVPFKVKAAEADGGRRIPRGSTHRAEILLERTDGFKGEIILDMAGNQQRHRQGIRGPALTVAAGQNRAIYPVFLPEWLETTRTSRIGLVAMARIPDPKGTPRYVLNAMEGQITMSIEGALMKLSHGAEETSVAAGKPFTIPLKLMRSPGLKGPVSVDLVIPDHLRGLLSADPLNLSPDMTTASLRVTSKADPRLRGFVPLTARARAMYEGFPVVSETIFEVEFLEK